jgi:hypothetical protein
MCLNASAIALSGVLLRRVLRGLMIPANRTGNLLYTNTDIAAKQEGSMTKDKLFDGVLVEMERVWGEPGFGGEPEAYDWLLEHYGITQEEDNTWMDICAQNRGELEDALADLTEQERAEAVAFLADDARVTDFLKRLLQRYQSSGAVYPHGEG